VRGDALRKGGEPHDVGLEDARVRQVPGQRGRRLLRVGRPPAVGVLAVAPQLVIESKT